MCAMREEIEKRYRIQEGYHRHATRASRESSHKMLRRNIVDRWQKYVRLGQVDAVLTSALRWSNLKRIKGKL